MVVFQIQYFLKSICNWSIEKLKEELINQTMNFPQGLQMVRNVL